MVDGATIGRSVFPNLKFLGELGRGGSAQKVTETSPQMSLHDVATG